MIDGPDYLNDDIKDIMGFRVKDFYGAELDEKGQAIIENDGEEIKKRKLPNEIIEVDEGVKIYEPPTEVDKWFTIGSDSYIPDREEFLVEKFKKDFPHITGVTTTEMIGALASRSPSLSEWLNKVNLEFSAEAQLPLWAKEIIPAKDFKDLQRNITELNKNESERSAELNDAAREYKTKLEAINKKFDSKRDKISNNDMVLALNANSTTLPLTVQLAIENYSPADSDAPTQKTYARELLLQWRQQLVLLKIRDPKFSVRTFINKQALK